MNEFFLSIISLLAGSIVGILGTYISAKQKFRDDLQARYDQTLHDHRINAYQALWQNLDLLALYARPEPVTPLSLQKLAGKLRNWYFETGGLFLTDNSRDTYFALQEAIKAELEKEQPEDQEIKPDAFETIRQTGSDLRTSLASDLRSRKQPQILD